MSALNPEQINELLKTPQGRTGGNRSAKADPTEDRQINTWFKLNHHLCSTWCEHRTDPGNTTGRSCWNPNCVDTRSAGDRGMEIVVKVKDQYICRYCFLAGYLGTVNPT